MSDSIENLRIDAAQILYDAFGQETANLFREYAAEKEAKDVIFFLKELLSEYLGEEKTTLLVDGLFIKYKLLQQ